MLFISSFDNVEDKMEAQAALATPTINLILSVFMSLKLHYLEVIQLGLLLRIQNLDLHFIGTWSEKFLF